ncbi:MAG: hypothetical protein FGM37_02870 [Phycisphaerales bacterium]|nr:hypothetical protein [Phycisphaerales bacterium]
MELRSIGSAVQGIHLLASPVSSVPAPHRSPALVIAGMHRSGTSMMAQAMQAAGLCIGEQLVPALPSNREGHFEDIDFHLLARSILADHQLSESGFLSDVQLSASEARRRQAEELVASRRAPGRPWGWKDPRTVLLLDFWAELLPEACFLFTFRAPWAVADSLFRRGDAACQDDPAHALRVWLHYNRLIRDFVRAAPGKCRLFEVGQVAADPSACVRSTAALMGIGLRADVSTFKPELLRHVADDARVALVHALSPASTRLYAELCEMAQSDAAVRSRPSATGLAFALERCLAQWARSSASTVEASDV